MPVRGLLHALCPERGPVVPAESIIADSMYPYWQKKDRKAKRRHTQLLAELQVTRCSLRCAPLSIGIAPCGRCRRAVGARLPLCVPCANSVASISRGRGTSARV